MPQTYDSNDISPSQSTTKGDCEIMVDQFQLVLNENLKNLLEKMNLFQCHQDLLPPTDVVDQSHPAPNLQEEINLMEAPTFGTSGILPPSIHSNAEVSTSVIHFSTALSKAKLQMKLIEPFNFCFPLMLIINSLPIVH